MSALELQPLLLQLERGPGPLTPQVLAALAAHGRPLRWAITAAERRPQGVARLQIEAVILRSGGQP
ncbi:MAG: hypothetical protein ACKOCA_00475 [Vulcanococcus sp.]